jgi:DNA (cytosine-5)-methyltransferase 1
MADYANRTSRARERNGRTGIASEGHPARSLRVVGLFAGIGGMEVGLGSAGHRTIRLCEKDLAARAVLEQQFPGVPIDEDICQIERLPPETDLVAAGFPCQDLSQVGRTLGLDGKHSSLVLHVFALLRKDPVPWVLLENVPFMLYLERGRTLLKIVSWLEELGYRWAYRVVDTRSFGLPQRRRRVFLLASLEGDPRDVLLSDDAGPAEESVVRNGQACGFYWTEGNRGLGWAIDAVPPLKGGSLVGIPSPPGIVLPGGKVVTPDIRDAERLQGFPPGWTCAADDCKGIRRSTRWRLIGNAVTVHVTRWIGRRLRSPTAYNGADDLPLPRDRSWPRAAWGTDEGRFAAQVSEWPVRYKKKPLAEFLRYEPTLLSERAADGFLRRALASNLTLDERFVSELQKHIEYMRRNGAS